MSDYNSTNSFNDPARTNRSSGFNNMQTKLPADPTSMVLAIIALVVTILCCCFGGQFAGLVMSIIGFVLAINSIKKYHQNPDIYDPNSLRKVQNAKTFNLVVLIFSGIFAAIGIAGLFVDSMKFDQEFLEDFLEERGYEVEESTDTYEYDEENDATAEDWQYQEEVDTLETESQSTETDSVISTLPQKDN
ncbi:MAG: CCC motif membrane protein [Nonlabens sp.]